MSEAITVTTPATQTTTQPLVCRLCRKETAPNLAEVELENISAEPLEISYRMTALQYLNLVVTGPDGRIVSEGHFGDRFAPTLEPSVLRLEPGEKFTATVHLFSTVRSQPVPAGAYFVRAFYECNGFRAVSDPVAVTASGT
jgi:hypothetical protein